MCEVSKLHVVAVVLADLYFPQDHFYCRNGGRGPCVWFSACVCVEYSWVLSLCRGRIIVDLQGLKTMSRHTSGTHSQSVAQWNTINSCLMLPHGRCPPCSQGGGKAESCETWRHVFCVIRMIPINSSCWVHVFWLNSIPHRCFTRLLRVTLTLWWLTSVGGAHLIALPSAAPLVLVKWLNNSSRWENSESSVTVLHQVLLRDMQ